MAYDPIFRGISKEPENYLIAICPRCKEQTQKVFSGNCESYYWTRHTDNYGLLCPNSDLLVHEESMNKMNEQCYILVHPYDARETCILTREAMIAFFQGATNAELDYTVYELGKKVTIKRYSSFTIEYDKG